MKHNVVRSLLVALVVAASATVSRPDEYNFAPGYVPPEIQWTLNYFTPYNPSTVLDMKEYIAGPDGRYVNISYTYDEDGWVVAIIVELADIGGNNHDMQ